MPDEPTPQPTSSSPWGNVQTLFDRWVEFKKRGSSAMAEIAWENYRRAREHAMRVMPGGPTGF